MKHSLIRFAAILGAVGLNASCATPKAVTTADHQHAPVSSFVGELDQLIPELMQDYGAPGVGVALIENGEIVFERGYGYSDVAARTPMTTRTRFNAASVSKALMAWGVMGLVDDVSINLDTPVFERITRWSLPASEFDSNGVTARRLLSHTAGVNRGTVGIYAPGDPLPSVEAALAGDSGGYGDTRLFSAPGSQFNYAGAGYSILQLYVEESTHSALARLLTARVMSPLGMNDTEFGWDAHEDPETSYYSELGEHVPAPRLAEIGAGGMNTTVHDLALFAAAHVAHGDAPAGRGVLRPETVSLMFTPAESARVTDGQDWGLGVMVSTSPAGRVLVGHSGGNPGVGAIYMVDPRTGDGVVIMTNRSWSNHVLTPIYCAWRNWSRADGEPEACPRDQIGLIDRAIAVGGLEAGRARFDAIRATQSPEFVGRAVETVAGHLVYANRRADAVAVARWGVELAPESAAAHELLGDALAEANDHAGAREAYNAALRLDPNNQGLRNKAGGGH